MQVDYTKLKKGGFIQQKQKDMFVMRLRTICGTLTAEDLRSIADLAEQHGRGYIHITTRQGVEIPWVHINHYNGLQEDIKRMGLYPGACGPRIRTVIACPGSEICRWGLVDARQMGKRLDDLFFGQEVPVKIKMAVSGCPNSCAKPQENDLGLMGVVEPHYIAENCTGCGVCAEVCPGEAITMVGDKPVLNQAKCFYEGNCISSCPADAWVPARTGYHLFGGGRIGKRPQLGTVLAEFVRDQDVEACLQAAINAFIKLMKSGERMADTINRAGKDLFVEELQKHWVGSAGEEVAASGRPACR